MCKMLQFWILLTQKHCIFRSKIGLRIAIVVVQFPNQVWEGETSMKQLLLRLHQDESGQDLIEYALVAALIAFAAVAAMQTLASQINNAFSTIGSKLTSAL